MRTTNGRREVTDEGPGRGWRYGDAIGRRNSDTRGLTGAAAGFHVEGDQPTKDIKREEQEVKAALADAARARRLQRRAVP